MENNDLEEMIINETEKSIIEDENAKFLIKQTEKKPSLKVKISCMLTRIKLQLLSLQQRWKDSKNYKINEQIIIGDDDVDYEAETEEIPIKDILFYTIDSTKSKEDIKPELKIINPNRDKEKGGIKAKYLEQYERDK